jgi:hypothetical protein
MKKLFLIILIVQIGRAEIKNLDAIILNGIFDGATRTLIQAKKLLANETNITGRIQQQKEAEREKIEKEKHHYKKLYEQTTKEYYKLQKLTSKNFYAMQKRLQDQIKELKDENTKLKKLLEINNIDYKHANIKINNKRKKKKIYLKITPK